jgi:ATP-binding cassette subfamily C (CFTR/MRP) protein 4
MLGILTMISIVNPYLLIPLAIAILLFACALKIYLRSAQDLKRLEGIKKSPVFNHLSASLNGISTIRASKITTRVTSEFDQLQNVHSAVYHLMVSSNEALGLWLDLISSAFIASVTFSFLYLNDDTASLVGLAVSQSLILTGMVQYGIRQSTESIQQMTSVERFR